MKTETSLNKRSKKGKKYIKNEKEREKRAMLQKVKNQLN
jgi:hypothetical protein